MPAQYRHSAYYYAYNYGWTYSESKTYTGAYLDRHTYRPRSSGNLSRILRGKRDFDLSEKEFDSTFNPLLLAACAMADIGLALRQNAKDLADTAQNFADPAWRAELLARTFANNSASCGGPSTTRARTSGGAASPPNGAR